MKKITLLVLTLLTFTFGFAQDTCVSAVVVSAGTTTVGMINGDLPNPDCAENAGLDPRESGEWYAYVPANDAVVNITTNIAANTGGDTRLHVYTGTCMTLTCVGGNDDVDGAGGNYLSDFTFLATAGTTYYIAWDNQWDDSGFDFVLTEDTYTCNYSSPYTETFDDNTQFLGCYTVEDADGDGLAWISQQDLDLDGDLTPETFATNANSSTAKDDWLFSPALSLTGGTEYEVTSIFNIFGGTAMGNFEAFIVDNTSSTATPIATLFSNSNIPTQGDFATLETMAYQEVNTFTPTTTGDYYIAYHSFGLGGSGFILLFDSNLDTSLSITDFEANVFKHSYDNNTDKLTLDSSTFALSQIEMHNILGQNVLTRSLSKNNEVIDMSGLKDGLYLAKVSIQGKTEVIKILKN